MLNLYVTSVNKKDGKTFFTSGLAATMQSLGYSTCVYKPVQTSGLDINGFMQSPDLTMIKALDPYIDTHFSYLFKTNTEPLIAAEGENVYIDIEGINREYSKLLGTHDCTLLDGEGGLLTPLAPNIQTVDMIKKLQIPVVLLVTPEDNAVNNALQTIYTAQEKGIELRGVVINNIKEDCSKERLTSITRVVEEYSNASILGLIPYLGAHFLPEELITGILNGIDIESIFKVKIEKLEFN